MIPGILDDLFLMHYGTKRHSGRYPWGSGDNPYQHSGDFLSRVKELRDQDFEFVDKDGKTYKGDTAIAKYMNLSTGEFRAAVSIANSERRQLLVEQAESLRSDGKSLNEIAKIMGFNNDSSVRALLDEKAKSRMNASMETADMLKKQIAEKGMLDVGAGVEKQLGISRERLEQALTILEMEGYPVWGAGVPQTTNPGKQTNIKVICPPGTPQKDIYDFNNVHNIKDIVYDEQDDSFRPKFVYPESIDSSRLMVRYGDEGGKDKDGLIEIRRGVPDLDLGESHYAQVRILVDGTHYIKGMAVYNDDMPAGTDVIFNTNKNSDVPIMGPKNNTILKPIKKDPDNPFGSLIKEGVSDPDDPDNFKGGQSYYYDADGNKKLSLINKRAEEGDWGAWADKIPSQFLSKQPEKLIKRQLDLTMADKDSEFDEIMSYTNPTVKKAMLNTFAEDCDSAAVHLKAAALPRQKYQVIIPLTSISDNEVYAPNYNDGETVALVRYPHGGTFEIPILKVNNKLPEGQKYLSKTPADAVGINSKVAERLSGADFDGDTVMVIPCNSSNSKIHIQSTPQLPGLKDFDPKVEYGGRPEGSFKVMKDTQKQMGVISNLITDMTLRGATTDELARAVRHSMVVIDAEKHSLDWKASERDNDIASLKKKYQGHIDPETGKYKEGAATLISRAKSQQSVMKRKGSPKVDDEGNLVWKEVEEYYTDPKTGKQTLRTQKSTKMAETKDARTLISDYQTRPEILYAEYANHMKGLARQARLAAKETKDIPYSAAAKKVYEKEVAALDHQINMVEINKPLERRAQMLTNSEVAAKKAADPSLATDKAALKKLKQQALVRNRTKVGAKRVTIDVSDKEWEAIQSGALSANKVTKVVEHMDPDKLKQRVMPRSTTQLSEAKQAKIKTMVSSGRYTNAEIAKALGISASTVSKYS